MKYLLLILLLAAQPHWVWAQDDTQELNDLENDLNELEGKEPTAPSSSEFKEETDDLGDLEQNEEQKAQESQPAESDSIGDLKAQPAEEDLYSDESDAPSAPLVDQNNKDEFIDVNPAPGEDDFTPVVGDTSPAEDSTSEPPQPMVQEPKEDSLSPVPPPIEEQPDEQIAQPTEAPLSPVPMQEAGDEPNYNIEKSISRSYSYILQNGSVESSWNQSIQGREQESYSVQTGDNLWEVSETLFGNPYFWPKLWQVNSRIHNPHEIHPGDKLVFVEGDANQAPVLSPGATAEESPTEMTVEEGEDIAAMSEEEILDEAPEIPQEEPVRPPLMTIPPSLGEWHNSKKAVDDFGGGKISKLSNAIPRRMKLSSLVFDEPLRGDGEVKEMEQGGDSAALYQYVFVKLNSGGVGDQFVAYMQKDKIKAEGNIAYPVEVQGVLKIVETVNASDNIYKAIVLEQVYPVTVGAVLRKGQIPVTQIDGKGPFSDMTANVMGGEFDDHRQLMASGGIIYLDKGSNDGLKVGSQMNVIKNQKVRNPNTVAEINSEIIGTLKLVDVKNTHATAVVTRSKEGIRKGDYTGSPAKVSVGIGGGEEDILDDSSDSSGASDSGSDSSFDEGFE